MSIPEALPQPVTDYALSLTLRALALADCPAGETDPAVTEFRVLCSPRVSGAFLIEFEHPGAAFATELRFFPFERRQERLLLDEFDALTPTDASWVKVSEPPAIRSFLYQAKRHLEFSPDNVRAVTLPLDFEPAQEALLAARSRPYPSSATIELCDAATASNDALGDSPEPVQEEVTQLSFGALAMDILSGSALRENAAHRERVAYAVWADPSDEYATLILRFFDAGATIAMAAYAFEGSTTELFQSQIEQLADFFENPPENCAKPQRISDILSSLILLDESATCERLGRVMGALARYGGHLNEPGLYGNPSEATVTRLDLLEEVTESQVWQSIVDGPTMFESIATAYLDEPEVFAWSRAREENAEARIEILEHADYPGCLMLASFEAAAQVPDVALYVADLTEELYDAYTSAVHLMMVDRRFGSHGTLPLSGKSPFKHAASDNAPTLLAQCLSEMQTDVGFDMGFTSESLREGYEEAIRAVFAEDCPEDSSLEEPHALERGPGKLH